jgi:hypothetical protein
MSYTMETELHLIAKTLPAEYRKRMEVECGETFEDEDEVPDIHVEVEYDPGWEQAGCRSGHPDNWTPDEGESPEITSIKLDGNHEILSIVNPLELAELTNLCWEDQTEQAEQDFGEPDDEPYYDDPSLDYLN